MLSSKTFATDEQTSQLTCAAVVLMEIDVHCADYSLAIKAGVHFTLCGGTVMKLGTAKHHQKYVDKMDSLELPGCFGMTELGHGSNVMVRHGPVNMKRCKLNLLPLSFAEAWQAQRCWYLQGIETQATYDPSSQQFVIKTPQNEASKFWIGGAGQHGKICTVFAQLTVGDKWQGPHVFVVRLRDDTGAVAGGVAVVISDNY